MQKTKKCKVINKRGINPGPLWLIVISIRITW